MASVAFCENRGGVLASRVYTGFGEGGWGRRVAGRAVVERRGVVGLWGGPENDASHCFLDSLTIPVKFFFTFR